MTVQALPMVAPRQERVLFPLDNQPAARAQRPPPFDAGDHLTRVEFERRYHAHPEIKKADLIEGVVYIPSFARLVWHGQSHSNIVGWLGVYSAFTRQVQGANSATVRLDNENEVQPDALLYQAKGGRARVTEDDYLAGPPELVVEIAASSAAYDLHVKRRVYQRVGVQEYLALQVYEQRADWFVLRDGVYETLAADEDGVLRSELFPGLRLNVPAFWAGDLAAMLATLQAGLATPEHATFAAQIA